MYRPGAWQDDRVLRAHQQLVADTLGDRHTAVLLIDGCDFAKQASYSVARQWCRALDKVANCQASVVACYASRHSDGGAGAACGTGRLTQTAA